jgi:hypothetical protein
VRVPAPQMINVCTQRPTSRNIFLSRLGQKVFSLVKAPAR